MAAGGIPGVHSVGMFHERLVVGEECTGRPRVARTAAGTGRDIELLGGVGHVWTFPEMIRFRSR
ncbi:hypothetical protein Mro03_68230 [Microbispora rosea subsp. rosea]|nr:hypothetical protein Mro03_68230 [Microbispora rosea subsp. rosea]